MNSTLVQSTNPAQQEAIEHQDGPLLIIAGAGTGKTHVITARVLSLLQKKIPAAQILALTFTEKAAQEMQERVDLALPLSHEEIAIKTFHGFCENVLRERGLEIGIDGGYRLLDSTEQWLFLKKNLFALQLRYYRPLGNPNKFLFTLLNHFSRLKDEDIAPETYISHGEACLKKASDEAGRETAEKMLEVARAYKGYQELMLRNNLMDFGDLQYYCLRLLESRPSVLAEYQERFRYLMVDEFQDTNFAQNKLVMLLAAKHRNLVVVGDDDQSIYKWRGASLSNIMQFEKNFPEYKKIVLTRNYRSTQKILDLSYGIIQNNNPYRLEIREGLEKRLLAHTDQEPSESPGIWHFSHYLEEIQAIARNIDEQVRQEKAHYSDFAILVRTNSIGKPIVEALKDQGIPFRVRSTEGLLHFDEIRDLIAAMRLLKNPSDDVAFFRLAALPAFDIPMIDLLQVVDQAKRAGHVPLFSFLRTSMRAEKTQSALPGLEADPVSAFQKFLEVFEALFEFSKQHSVSRILGEFLKNSGYYDLLLSQENALNAEKIQRIGQFLEIARSFEQEGSEKDLHPLRAFLEYLELLEQAESALEPLEMEEQDAVTISTIHSSKGLEFPTVFIPSMVAQRFPSIDRRDPLEIPRALVGEELPDNDQHLQEERRLFYVACTRAKKRLILSYSDLYEGRKKWKPSLFIQEALATGMALVQDFAAGSADPSTPKVEVPDEKTTDARLMAFPEIKLNHLSYSQLNTFQSCPLQYKFRYLFHVPSPMGHAATFGSSLHNALNAFYQKLQSGSVPNLELLRTSFQQTWIPSGYESRTHEEARKEEGWKMLEAFYIREESSGFRIPAYLEKGFRLRIGQLTLSGRIDRIDRLEDGTYEVVDYKTGTSRMNEDIGKDLQLSLYALACKESLHLPVSKLSLYFLEDGTKISTTRSPQSLQEVRTIFEELAQEMVKSDFMPTPGFHCKFCDYRLLCPQAQ